MDIKHHTTKRVLYTTAADSLKGLDLRYLRLYGANLYALHMEGIILRHSDLRTADLRHSYLNDAKLDHANLCGADFRGAVLTGANFNLARMRGVNLRRAALAGADFSTTFDIRDGGQDTRGYRFVAVRNKGAGFRIYAGCQVWTTGAAALSHYSKRHYHGSGAREECLERVKFLIKVAKLAGWDEGV